MRQCNQCGGRFEGGKTCQDVFDEFLSLEFSNPDFGRVHFLTVACFMIQHDRYSDEGLSWIRSALQDYLELRLTPRQLREIAAGARGIIGRDWAIIRDPHTPPRRKVSWSITIADVALKLDNPENYRSAVMEWAQSTLREMDVLFD